MRAVDDYVRQKSRHEPNQMPNWITIGKIAEALDMYDTRAGLESVRRAMKSLEAEGVLELDGHPRHVWVYGLDQREWHRVLACRRLTTAPR